jgi:hypothetical protein
MKNLLVLALMLVSITCTAKKKKVLKEVSTQISNIDSSFTIENERYEVGVRKVIWIDYLFDEKHCQLEMPYSDRLGRIIFSVKEMGNPIFNGTVSLETRSIKVSTNIGDFIFLNKQNTIWIAFQEIDQTEF